MELKKTESMYAQKVREFAVKAAENQLPNTPQNFTKTEVDFLTEMVQDELAELQVAKDLTEQADALVDAIYYIIHAACQHGINLDRLFSIVHEANMAKVRNGVKRRADGKILKPEDWEPPEPKLLAEINSQTQHGAFS